jgi:hypothetical protein
MKRELESKLIAPYFQYNVRIQGQTHGEIHELTGLTKGVVMINHDTRGWADISDVKLVLHPLSEFGDSDDVRKVHEFLGLGNWCEMYDEYFRVWFDDLCNIDKLVLQAPQEIFNYFLANHYDVFSLIPNGLAIDINTLK